MSLQNLQVDLSEIILSSSTDVDWLKPTQCLAIYRNNIYDNLSNTLKSIYVMVRLLVGDDYFQSLMNDYIKQYPSRSSNLHDYGEYFKCYLAEIPSLRTLCYLEEVAEFEWLMHTLYFAAEHDALNINHLAHITPHQYENLHFTLHPASYLKQFKYPILRIIDLCNNDNTEDINLNEGGVNLLMIRREFKLMLVSLSPAEYVFLNSLNNGHSLSASLTAALIIDEHFKLEEKLPQWINDKTIVDFYLDYNKTV